MVAVGFLGALGMIGFEIFVISALVALLFSNQTALRFQRIYERLKLSRKYDRLKKGRLFAPG